MATATGLPGLMQRRDLLISDILEHAARQHGTTEVVSRRADGRIDRADWAGIAERARRMARALAGLGVQPGERVATLAMNSDRHLELYYAVTGIGAVCNTINPRLAPDDVAWIAEHAGDTIVFADPALMPIVEAIAARLPALRAVVVLAEAADPRTALPPHVALHAYEDLLPQADPAFAWPRFDEHSASLMCYTSGTTGRPKGVLYSHRSIVLHAMAMAMADASGLRATDRVLMCVPLFHVNAWGLPFTAGIVGAALVMPGRHLDPASLIALCESERITFSGAVPTVWLGILQELRRTGGRLPTLARIMSGGAAFPRALMAEYAALGIEVHHAWGMTESSPLATWNAPKPASLTLDAERRLDEKASQGRGIFGVEVCGQDDQGREVARDGATNGNLVFRGHWVASGYYRQPESSVGDMGWFPTGDVGVIDAEGFVRLTDRTKDLIKSGGEWISSIQLENIAIEHPDVAEAAAIAVPDEKWSERPLLIVVPRDGCTPDPQHVRAFFEARVPRWSIPDQVMVVDSLPHGATGKILKTELRRRYAQAQGEPAP